MIETRFYSPFVDFIERDSELDAQSKTFIGQNFPEVTYRKGQLILKEGSVCNNAHFIVSGKGRSFYTRPDGKTVTWLFHFNEPASNIKNLFFGDYRSFLTFEPAKISIEALSDVTTIQISRPNRTYLLERSILFERWMRNFDEKALIIYYERVFTLLNMPAAQRYNTLLQSEPHLLDLFSDYYIATYLGITAQSLSRIRRSLACRG